jgi:hypothetical protein
MTPGLPRARVASRIRACPVKQALRSPPWSVVISVQWMLADGTPELDRERHGAGRSGQAGD